MARQKSDESTPAMITAIGAVIVALIGAGAVWVSRADTEKPPSDQNPSDQAPKASPTQFLPFALDARFFPSGWMGDGKLGKKYLMLEFMSADVNGETRMVTRIDYSPGPDGWAGIYWQTPDGNWGTQPGVNLTGASAISFLAHGEVGGEVVEFKSGGIRGQYSDSYERSIGKVSLQRRWVAYQIPLGSENLSSVIGAFAWSAPAAAKPIRFYLANLEVR